MIDKLPDLLDEEEIVICCFLIVLAVVNTFFPLVISALMITSALFVLLAALGVATKSRKYAMKRQQELLDDALKILRKKDDAA